MGSNERSSAPLLTRFSTEKLPPREQFAFWREQVGERFDMAELSRPGAGAFRAHVETVSVAGLSLSDIHADPLMFERTEHHVARRERDQFAVGLLFSGEGVVEQDGRDTRLQAGDIVLCDSRRPCRIRFDTPFRQMVFNCDRAELEARLPDADRRTAQRIEGQGALPSAAANYLFDLAKQARSLGAAEGVVVQHALDLLALTLGELATREVGHGSLFRRIRAFIEENLADPLLTPTQIAQRHQLSRRYLYRLFDESGDCVAAYIRRRRLERCKAALADPLQRSRSISDLAFAWGFNDASHFGRLFREAFGLTPRDFRRAAEHKPF
jgi:AraC-like DNA-binding protein